MKIDLNYYQTDLVFEAKGSSGVPILLGQTAEGSELKTTRPMELLLMSLASCSSVDIVRILKTQKQSIDDYRVEVNANRQEGRVPALFDTINLKYVFEGDISPLKIERAVNLSLEKYCSVYKILEPTAKINYELVLNGKIICLN